MINYFAYIMCCMTLCISSVAYTLICFSTVLSWISINDKKLFKMDEAKAHEARCRIAVVLILSAIAIALLGA